MRNITTAATTIVVPEDTQRSVIRFLMLESVSVGEIHERMCAVYGMQNVITKSFVKY